MQVSIFQGDAIFQQRQRRSFGKGLEKAPKLGLCARAPEMPQGRGRASSRDQKQRLAAVKNKKKEKGMNGNDKNLIPDCRCSLETDVMQMRSLQKLITLKGQNSQS